MKLSVSFFVSHTRSIARDFSFGFPCPRKLGLHLHPFCREDRTAPAEHPFAIALGSKSTEHAPRDAVQRGVRELVVGPELGAEHGHGHGWQSCCHVTFYGAEQAMLCPLFQA